MSRWLWLTIALLSSQVGINDLCAEERGTLLVIVGAEGSPEYGKLFRSWTERWKYAAEQARTELHVIGHDADGDKTDLALVQERLLAEASPSSRPLWIILIGHGTFDGTTAKFNLRGPDFTQTDLDEMLRPIDRPTVVINCASSSGPFLSALSKPGRVVITATRSGHEYNFARFGEYMSSAVVDLAADLDKDEQVSLLEAFLLASAKLGEFYRSEARLATEHCILDDNGDRQGTPPDWYKGLRIVKSAKDGAKPDGDLAKTLTLLPSELEMEFTEEFRAQRDALEQQLSELRARKGGLSEDEYQKELEQVLLRIAQLYEEAEAKAAK